MNNTILLQSEYLSTDTKNGGICAVIGGINAESGVMYIQIEDTIIYVQPDIERGGEFSTKAMFGNLEDGRMYSVRACIENGGETALIECAMTARKPDFLKFAFDKKQYGPQRMPVRKTKPLGVGVNG